VLVKAPLVTTDLPLPKTDSADIAISTTLENVTDQLQTGTLKAKFGDISVEKSVELAPHESKIVKLDPSSDPALHLLNPKLWWPNGYGPQNLYDVHLSFEQGGQVSDSTSFLDGVRKIQYSVPDSPNLTISVNGVRIFIRGGDWGLDEAMKRIPRERLEAEIKMHAMANMNLIRNWVGQSTGEDFYELMRQVRHPALGRVLPAQPVGWSESHRPAYVHGECAGQDSAISQPSCDRRLVRSQ
jgi:beta-galactosidase/beta-glucuronidase